MKHAPLGIKTQEVPFSDADFRNLADLARTQFGLNLAESKKPLVYSRLTKRLRARNVKGFSEYLSLLRNPDEEIEKFELISALTTNVTSFFRESHHFDTLRENILPRVFDQAKHGEKVRFWSAGCSAGPEPYSIAMTVLEGFPQATNYDIKILATDIDPKIIAKARTGTYPIEELSGISNAQRSRWTNKNANEASFTVSDELKKLIIFNELNLISEWPMRGTFDAIFCRNVAIYFDQPTQQKLWLRFCGFLKPKGVLFIGHSERITGPASTMLEGIGITSYRKTTIHAAPTSE